MPAQRVQHFTESVIRETSRWAAKYGAINLGQGMPDFPAPPEIIEAACQAVRDGFNQYAITWGAPGLRRAVAAKYARETGLACDPDTNVTVCCGATECMMASMLALVDPGDEVVIFQPFYENYGPDAIMCGAKPVWVELRWPDWSFDPDELRRAFSDKTRAVIINTPNNPTGKVFTRGELQLIADQCQKYDAWAFADEIYEHIIYADQPHVSIASLPGMAERTVTISGLSKTFSVTGWRLGHAVAPAAATDAIRKVHDFLTVGAPHPLQVAAAAALELPASYYTNLRDSYLNRRELFLPYLREAGFDFRAPEGAYYVMTDAAGLGATDDHAFVRDMVERVGVCGVPGSSFTHPPERGRTWVRFMFAKRDETLHEAGRRLLKLRR